MTFGCDDLITRIHDLTGTLVLDLSEDAGWGRQTITGSGSVAWRYDTIPSRYFHGELVNGPPVMTSVGRAEQLWVRGDESLLPGDERAFWESTEDRIDALIAAVSQQFLWVVSHGGHLWTYRTVGPADVDAGNVTRNDLHHYPRRSVVLSFRVQPNPSKVPLGGGV